MKPCSPAPFINLLSLPQAAVVGCEHSESVRERAAVAVARIN